MDTKRILIYGWFGEGNIGDELLLNAAIALVKSAIPNSSIRVMGPKPNKIEAYHSDQAIDLVSTSFDKSFLSKVRLLKYGITKTFKNSHEADIVLFVTGGALSDWNPASTKTLFDLIRYWKTRGKQMFMFGVGAGPISKHESYKLFRSVLSEIDCITVRDEFSYRELVKTGLQNVIKTKDLVYELHRKSTHRPSPAKVKKIGIVAAPVCMETPEVYLQFRQSLSETVGRLLDDDYEVSLIPFQPQYDSDLMGYISQENPGAHYLFDGDDFWFPLRNLKKQDLVIGQRYHSLIESVIACKLVIPIVYHPKCWSFCLDFGLEKYASHIGNGNNWRNSNINPDQLCCSVQNIQQDREYLDVIANALSTKYTDNTEYRILSQLLQPVA